jgi:uncharacterized protein YbjT (DUF2867 family)
MDVKPNASNARKILVTGASGYVGGRLVRQLLNDPHRGDAEVRVYVRDRAKIFGQSWFPRVEVAVGSALDFDATKSALHGIHTAFYLLHSINAGTRFDQEEFAMASTFARTAEEDGVTQIVYLGGIANGKERSYHLASRENTGKALASGSVPVFEMRAGIVIGSGSASFEMLRHLTHRLPIMTTPKWISNRTQPIAIRDVLYYLECAANLEDPISGIFDIGGPDVMPYAEMMQEFARVSGLRKRIIMKVPVLTPNLSSLWIGLVTPVPASLARPLVGSLISEVVVDPEKSITPVIPLPPQGLIPVRQAFELALSHTSDNNVPTRWSDANILYSPWQKTQGDPEWAGEATFRNLNVRVTDATSDSLWKSIEAIGGETGWYGADFLWRVRGLMDRAIGGVGVRRGRRDPVHLRVGDAVDFWRVEKLETGRTLKLRAEMILPGIAWLEFTVEEVSEGNTNRRKITQEAIYQPRGLLGALYWWVVSPFHFLIFPTMIKNLIRSAKRRDLEMDIVIH